MKILTLFTFIFLFSQLNSQVKPGAFKGTFVMEYVWSESKKEHVFLERNELIFHVVLTEKTIYFQKGKNADWLKNDWEFIKREKNGNEIFTDTYSDERNQIIVIDYTSSFMYYYYNWDIHNETFSNIAAYPLLIVDDEIDVDKLNQNLPERFTLTYNRFSAFYFDTTKWTPWVTSENKFVINANKDGDIVHYKGDGSTAIYKVTSQVRMDEAEGKEYQIVDAIDDKGLKIEFQIFEDEKIGLKLIYKNAIFQFAYKR